MKQAQRRILIPSWIPPHERAQIDLSELADADGQLRDECDRLGELLDANVAAYKTGAKAQPTGLCTVFKFAELSIEQASEIAASEQRHSNVIFVAYARPLTRW